MASQRNDFDTDTALLVGGGLVVLWLLLHGAGSSSTGASRRSGAPGRRTITVRGDRCGFGKRTVASCSRFRIPAPASERELVYVDATWGRHGSVETLLQRLRTAGYEPVMMVN